MRGMRSFFALLVLAAGLVFAPAAESQDFSGTYTTSGLTIHLEQSGTTLSGTFDAGVSGNVGGFVDANGRAYTWLWFDSQTAGSAVLAGNLTLSGNQGTFSFGGGQTSGGRLGEVVMSGMTKSSLSGSTTTSNSSTNNASYAGTYTSSGFTLTLTQSGATLSGTFNAGSVSGNAGGFLDSFGRAYLWVWFDTSGASGVLAGSLSISGNQGTLSLGGGQSAGGRLSEVVLSGLTWQAGTTTNFSGSYLATNGSTLTLTQSGSSLTGTATQTSFNGTITISGTISGSVATVSTSASATALIGAGSGCTGSGSGTFTLNTTGTSLASTVDNNGGCTASMSGTFTRR